MKSEAMFPNHNDIELPFVIHAIGTAQRQYRRKRDEGCCFAQVIYGETGEGRLSGNLFLSAAGHAARLLAADGGMADQLALL